MTTLVFVQRFLNDYARNPVNLLLLIVVPTVFVLAVSGELASFAKLLGGPEGPAIELATAGWAAGFMAGVAMYFQTATTRGTDRRVVIAGLPAARLALARLVTGGCLAVLAAATALLALVARTGVADFWRAFAGTLMFAAIYIAIGAVVGVLVRNPLNGSVIVLFVWIVDVFFGPAMSAGDNVATRLLPTHYVTLWMIDLPSGHSGPVGELGWALIWTASAVGAACALIIARTRTAAGLGRSPRAGSRRSQTAAALRAAWRDNRRNAALWALLVVVPVVFILGVYVVTPDQPISIVLHENGENITRRLSLIDPYGATMVPVAIASLAALIGLFGVLQSRNGDRRAALAGMRTSALLSSRLGILTVFVLVVTGVALATSALIFSPVQWAGFASANVLIALTYGFIGALLGPIFGSVGGVFVVFMLAFLDIGIVQNPMLQPEPTAWSRLLPGYGGSQVLIDQTFTRSFDEVVPLLVGLGWLVSLGLAVVATYHRATRPARPVH
ncbi:ABC transporter permease [Cryobacterium psychrophilum]|uniref:ABC transporter permease n=1 Tax=Cryobacterium psychrophilum TaxID=41988 RepID=A0A4Y8KRE9_9MICO|nr:ABC transporter permease [Cryobacterium psychrophilum]TDW28878.1 ABC-2 family transporter [Cryobacterium psychrophilum]TFD81072.1 ABC transporter permease [Cryobacterium psychrophilum]